MPLLGQYSMKFRCARPISNETCGNEKSAFWPGSCQTLASVARQPRIGTLLYPPLQRSWKGGILVSACPSVRLSVCGHNHVCSVSSTILIGSISYLHILSNNFRRCVVCNVCFKNKKFGLSLHQLSTNPDMNAELSLVVQSIVTRLKIQTFSFKLERVRVVYGKGMHKVLKWT